MATTVVEPPQAGPGRVEGLRAEVARRLGSAPGRLRAVGGLLVVLLVLFGALTAVQVNQRNTAAENVRTHSQPLSNDAAEIFRSLADADTTAATGFLQAGSESQTVRRRYNADVQRASALLAQAAARTSADDPGQQWITRLNQQLPSYTSLVSTAGSYNRVGYPLGGAYLRYASANMQQDGGMLTEARALYDAETARLHRDYADAKSFPWAAVGLGLVVLAVLAWTQLRLFRRTNRVFNPGLVTATLLTLAGLLWLTAGQTVATLALSDADSHGSAPLQVVNTARITALQCRGAENLNLVARGSTADYEDSWEKKLQPAMSAELAQARSATGGDGAAQADLATVSTQWAAWQKQHDAAKALNDGGSYDKAVAATIGTAAGDRGTISASFNALDASLNDAVRHEQAQFAQHASDAHGATSGLAVGAAVLAVLAALAAVLGINRRVAEYR